MFRTFHPTHAVEEDLARRGGCQEKSQAISRAHLSKNWRQITSDEARPLSRVPACMAFYPSGTLTVTDLILRKAAGMSLHYRGDPTVASNRSAAIPNSENTSLWVMGLPREWATYYSLMDLLKGRGKIFATNITEAKSQYLTAAATITFFRHIDAENAMRAMNDGTLSAPVGKVGTKVSTGNTDRSDISADGNNQGNSSGGQCKETTLIDLDIKETSPTSTVLSKVTSSHQPEGQLLARWNRVRVAEPKLRRGSMQNFNGRPQFPSRVIHVCGRVADVNPDSLEAYFSSKFRYNLDRIIYHGIQEDGLDHYEYRFACWKNQAEFAAMALRRERPDIRCWYGIDPCEVVKGDVHILDIVDPMMKVNIPILG
ncbi:hypothetical protein GGS21DRAFT_515730 [Xylaria nigripes]|nr:hypothetical protein GGS21DRAFT_515730 [Xylaria nigripes]